MIGATETVTLDTVQSDVWHLYYLLDTVVDLLMEMEYVRDGKRDIQLDRTAALAWIARDKAHHIGRSIDENFNAIRGREAHHDHR